jgi:hypothetical protein
MLADTPLRLQHQHIPTRPRDGASAGQADNTRSDYDTIHPAKLIHHPLLLHYRCHHCPSESRRVTVDQLCSKMGKSAAPGKVTATVDIRCLNQ